MILNIFDDCKEFFIGIGIMTCFFVFGGIILYCIYLKDYLNDLNDKMDLLLRRKK